MSVFGRRIKGMIRLWSEQVWTCNVTWHVHTCSGRNRIIPLMRRPNTDSEPNKPVTLPRNPTFDTLRGHESRPHSHDGVLRYVVTLQVCTHPKGGYTLVTLQVTDTIRSYDLNSHPVPHGVTVSCEHWGFPGCYESPNDVFATSSGFVHLHYTLKKKRKGRTVVTCHVARPDLLRP